MEPGMENLVKANTFFSGNRHRSITCDFKVLAAREACLPTQGAQLKMGDRSA